MAMATTGKRTAAVMMMISRAIIANANTMGTKMDTTTGVVVGTGGEVVASAVVCLKREEGNFWRNYVRGPCSEVTLCSLVTNQY